MRFFRVLALSIVVALSSSFVSLVFIRFLLSYEYYVQLVFTREIACFLCVAFSVFAGSFLLFVFKEFHARGAGVENIIRDYHMPLRVFRVRTLLLKIISTIITIGGGGSGGIQGPSVYIGGFIGGWIAEKIRVNYIERKTLMLVGIAAVLSAIFKAPLGAFFYAIEIPYKRDFETRCIVPVLIGSIIGLLFSISFNIGFDFKFPSLSMNYMSLLDPFMILLYILFGLYTVLVAVCFIYLDQLVYRFRKSVLNYTGFEPVIIAVFSLIVGLIIFLEPMTYGTGMNYVSNTLFSLEESLHKLSLVALLILVFAKMLATSLTIKSGASAGYFGPGIFIGALSGMIYYKLLVLLGIEVKDPLVFTYLGMAAFYGSISAAPIGTSILVTELTRNHFFILPSLLSSLIARELIINNTLYKSQRSTRLKIDIERLLDSFLIILRNKPDLLNEPVSKLNLPRPPIIAFDDTLNKALLISLNSIHRVIPVRKNDKIVGVIDVRRINPQRILTSKKDTIEEYVLKTPIVKTNTSIKKIVELMSKKNIDTIIVVNEFDKYLGIVNTETLQKYLLYLAWWMKNGQRSSGSKRS